MSDDEPLMQMRTTRHAEVAISLEDMYRILIAIDAKVTTMSVTLQNALVQIKDHETRIRDLETGRLSESRIKAMEDDIKAILGEQESLKRRLYAIPSAATVIALIAVVITVARWL